MFTGIVETMGQVVRADRAGNGVRLVIEAPALASGTAIGASIAVAGVCQTVLAFDARTFTVGAEAETLRLTTLGRLRAGDRVNLERALPAHGRFDGHLVLGHVDGTARVAGVREDGRSHTVELDAASGTAPYIVPKGCVTLDGVSLTVGAPVRGGRFEVHLIPHTWEQTTLHTLRPGMAVNVETDILVRTVAHLLAGRSPAVPGSGIGWDDLQRAFADDRTAAPPPDGGPA